MKLAVGPLTTGTYTGHAVDHPKEHYGIRKDADGTKIGLLAEKELEGSKWYLEKVGENRFKSRNVNSGVNVSISSADKQTLEPTEGEGLEWNVEPTDVEGEYIWGPANDKSTFVTATAGEPTLKVGSKSEGTRFRIYRVDDV